MKDSNPSIPDEKTPESEKSDTQQPTAQLQDKSKLIEYYNINHNKLIEPGSSYKLLQTSKLVTTMFLNKST